MFFILQAHRMKRVLLVTLLFVVVLCIIAVKRKTSEYILPTSYIGSVAQDNVSKQAAADSYITEICPGLESDTTSSEFLKFKAAVDDLGIGYMAVWPLTISRYTGAQPAGTTVEKYKAAYEFPFWAQIASTADIRGAWFRYAIGKCPQIFTIEEQISYAKWSYNPSLITNARVTTWSQSAGNDGIFSGQTVLEVPATSTEAWKSTAIDPVTNLPTTRAVAMMMYGPASMIEYPDETPLYAFSAHTFTPAGATGMWGPSQAQVNTAYGATFASRVSVVGGIQKWTVPQTGMYIFDVKGAAGGNDAILGWEPGYGRRIRGVVPLFKGEIINILVGQKGIKNGGGGGTFIVRDNGTVPLIIAGGGTGTRLVDDVYRHGARVDDSAMYPFYVNPTTKVERENVLITDGNIYNNYYKYPINSQTRHGGGFMYDGKYNNMYHGGKSYMHATQAGWGGEYTGGKYGGFGGGSAASVDAAGGGYMGGVYEARFPSDGTLAVPATSFLDGSVLYPNDSLTGGQDGFATFTLCAAGSYIDPTTYTCVTCSTAGSYCPKNTTAVYTCPLGEYCSTAATRAPCTIGNYCPTTGMSAPTPCTAGNYCPTTGMSEPTPCTAAGYYCPVGATSQTQYPCSTCSASQYQVSDCSRTEDRVCAAKKAGGASCYASAQCISDLCIAGACTALTALNSFTMTWGTRGTIDGSSTQIAPAFLTTQTQCAQACLDTGNCVGFTMDWSNSFTGSLGDVIGSCAIFSALRSRSSSKATAVYMKK
jgi:hypothetical protein